ncbi:MAG: hypothetical protein ACKVPY_02520 [Paracoccaceae bacterium]
MPIRDEDDYRNAVRYVVSNPVKHGFVERPEDWPYSSIRRDRARGESEWQGGFSTHHLGVEGEWWGDGE